MEQLTRKILLLAPCVTRDSTTTKWLHPCIGVIRIQGYLERHGHRADCFDPALYQVTKKGPSLEERLKEEDWDIIGFSVLEESLAEDIGNMHLASRSQPRLSTGQYARSRTPGGTYFIPARSPLSAKLAGRIGSRTHQ